MIIWRLKVKSVMGNMKWTLAVFLGVLSISNAWELEGSKVYIVSPRTKVQYKTVGELASNLDGVDFWVKPSALGHEGRVFVEKKAQPEFERILTSARIDFHVFLDDVQPFLEDELAQHNLARTAFQESNDNRKIGFTSYHRHNEMNEYLDDLAEQYPSLVRVETLGLSSEGREVKSIRISTTQGADKGKPIVVIDAGIHAREWIAPSVGLYIIHKLVENITESDLVENIDWYIIPLINPDGYEYSQQTSANRMWRKTRSIAPNSTCIGADANRNFDYRWMELGASSDPCTNTYAGTSADSEPEASYLSFMLRMGKPRIKLYLALHSHGSYLIYPFSDGSEPPNRRELQKLGDDFVDAVNNKTAQGSKKYVSGNAYDLLQYRSTGNSKDFALGTAGVELSYTLELPGGGDQGFDLPPSRINQVVKEIWEGVVVLGRYVHQNTTVNY